MKKLTQKILDEEAKKYFQKIKAQIDIGMDYEYFSDTMISVFPEYPEWVKKTGNKALYAGSKSTGWVMQEYISEMVGLVHHLIENNYPQEAILAILPRNFSLRVAKRLNE